MTSLLDCIAVIQLQLLNFVYLKQNLFVDLKEIEECQRKVGMASLKLRTRCLLKMPFRLKYRTDT